MITIKEALRKLETLVNDTKFNKMIGFMAIFTELLEKDKLKPIIVGGLAVEIYSLNEYTTSDIDIVFSQRMLADQYLVEMGFQRQGRYWYHERLLLSIEIPDDILAGSNQKIVEITLPTNQVVYVIGIEDLILDRLRACVHWKSNSDCEWAKRLYLIHEQRLDRNYLFQIAKIDQTDKIINSWT